MHAIQLEPKPIVHHNLGRSDLEQDCACGEESLVLAVPATSPQETDCACAPPFSRPAGPPVKGALWHRAPLLHRAPLPAGHELLLPRYGPAGPVVLNAPARAALAAFARPRPLADATARELAALGLLIPAGAPPPALCPAPAGDTLTAWLHVTNACNLRCSYCYVHQDRAGMDEATGQAALQTIFRTASRYGFRAIKLKYAGGEPTLHFARVRALHEEARRMAHQQGLEVRETLISNGVTLSDEVLAYAAAAGMRLALSLDASRQAHDAHRTFPNGRGTFARVCRSVERALKWGLHPHLSITLSGTAGEESAEAVALALEHDLPFNLNFVRPARGTPSAETLAGLVTAVRAALAQIEAHLPRRSLLAILDRADFSRPHRHACGAGRSYLVVDHRGRLSPCQMELSHPAGDLTLEDPLAALRAAFPNPAVEERSICATCPWRYGCAGGCPRLAGRTATGALSPSPYCSAYRTLYPELLRLEGLRLMRWGPQG